MQYDVHALPNGQLVVDVQADALSLGETCVVVPLVPADDDARPIRGLTPVVRVGGKELMIAVQLVSVVRRRDLSSAEASLQAERLTIQAALDLLLNGH